MEQILMGECLFAKIISGAQQVLKIKDHLNKINVFPVSDGDTGENLASLMNSIIDKAENHKSIDKVAKSIADVALSGARGNSGIIFAQFFQGMNKSLKRKTSITMEEFAHAMTFAFQYAYKAIDEPVEGTIITVMSDWVKALRQHYKQAHNFTDLIVKSLEASKISLKETTQKLQVLKDAGVVDAGAKGFVHFIEGFKHSTIDKQDQPLDQDDNHSEEEVANVVPLLEMDIRYRYCTEMIIHGDDINSAEVKRILSSYGDSLIVAGNSEKCKIHIHTNEPNHVFTEMRKIGTVKDPKVDDMKMQSAIHFNRKYSIAVVSDSSCDLPQDFIDEHQIFLVPFNVTFNNHQLLDKVSLKTSEFYSLVKNENILPISSTPTIQSFIDVYSQLDRHYDKIISIHISKNFSSTYKAAKQAASQFGDKIEVIDSKEITTSQGYVVKKVVEEISKGSSFDEVLEKTQDIIDKSELILCMKDVKALVRSGRLSPLKGFIAKTLKVKPIINVDKEGKNAIIKKSVNFNSSLKYVVKKIQRLNKTRPIEGYFIGHADSEEKARQFGQQLTQVLDIEPLAVLEASPVVGANTGLGSICVSFMFK